MKFDMQENQISHAFRTFLLPTTLTEEDIALCSRALRKPKMSGEKSRLIENANPKSTRAVKKQPLKRFSEIAEWQESKKLVLEPCVFATEKTCVQHSYTVIANITAKSLNFWLIKLVKEQSLIVCNTQFLACVILKEC